MPNVDNALEYVRAGIAVLPIWPARDGRCTCPKGGEENHKSPSKHPITRRGVYDASLSEERVREWWDEYPDANIGLALGDISSGLYVMDLDELILARKVLTWYEALSDEERREYGIVVARTQTGGAHVYMRCEESYGLSLLYVAGYADKVGELRGNGTYVVAAPSVNASGGRYAWVNASVVQTDLKPSQSVLLGFSRVLVAIGEELVEGRTQQEVLGDAPAIEPMDCPFPRTGLRILNQLLTGTFPEDDRSKVLYRLAVELTKQAKRKDYPITAVEVAGVLKKVDAVAYRKYSDRSDADQRYWTTAIKAGRQFAENPAEATGVRSRGDGVEYVYSDQQGLFFLRERGQTKVANFRPELLHVTNVQMGADEQALTEYVVRCSLPQEEIEITLSDKDLNSGKRLREALQPQLGWRYRVEPDQWERVWLAACQFGAEPISLDTYGRTGWHKGNLFILPGATGGFRSSGMDETVRFHGFPEGAPSRWSIYGKGVRPAETADEYARAAAALSDLLDIGPASIVVPMLAQVLGGPLCSLGLHNSPPLVHLEGHTGEFKTAVSLTFLSLFGRFTSLGGADESSIPMSWSSTVSSIQNALYHLRDITAFVDDYKSVHMKETDVARIVQAYADRTTRDRMGSDQSMRKSLVPAALFLSSGEEGLESQESVEARVLTVPWGRRVVSSQRLSVCQQHAASGALALAGGTYLQFLAEIGTERVSEMIEELRDVERTALNARVSIHPRKANTMTSLSVAQRVVQGFFKAKFPELEERWRVLRHEYMTEADNELSAAAEEARDLSPLQRLLIHLREVVAAGDVRLIGRHYAGELAAGRQIDVFSSRVVGFYDQEFVYLTKSGTYGWFNELARRQGSRVPDRWESVVKEAKETVGGEKKVVRVGDKTIKALILPHAVADLVDPTRFKQYAEG